jgi:uncharacterized membrane protein
LEIAAGFWQGAAPASPDLRRSRPMSFFASIRARIGLTPSRPSVTRLGLVDVARGLAVLAMVTYHSAWDLSELRLMAADIREIPAWAWFSHAIAGSFLVLVGVGLVLAQGRGFRPRAFLQRLARIVGAALLVTIGTYLVFPEAYVFFGILHCIALASVLALPFLQAPPLLVIAAAAASLLAPLFVTASFFNLPILSFLGLGTRIPVTNDYVPLFPWFGLVLTGVAAMQMARALLARLPERTIRYPALLRALAFVGRHSLIIYLLHQPLIFGALSGWVALVGRDPAVEAAPFLRRCEASCGSSGESAAVCRAACTCAMDTFKTEHLWGNILEDRASPEERGRISSVARLCFNQSRGGSVAPRPD